MQSFSVERWTVMSVVLCAQCQYMKTVAVSDSGGLTY